MPGIVSGRKRPSVAVSDDESESVSSSSGSKRARRDASEDPSSSRNDSRPGKDEHQPGSLVRVKLTNFVTYSSAEFHLGPSLNMIIGPNGTGKSTLVCAMCLGLGFPTQYLGRAKEIGEFVKHGSAEAEIEIELAGRRGHRNPVIRRKIQKEGNKTSFSVNGVHTNQKEIKKLAESFSIQINNLCQFLPQDRVVEFAKMDAITRLSETLRAAASPQMVEWHDELKQLRREEKELEVEQQNNQNHLKALQDKQNSTRQDVERHQQRQELVTKSKALDMCRPFIQYRDIRAELDQIKANRKAAQTEQRRYEAEAQPARDAEAEMESYRDSIGRISRTRKHRFEECKGSVEELAKKIHDGQRALKSYLEETETEKKDDQKRRQDMKRLEVEINNLNHQSEHMRAEYDQRLFNDRLDTIRAKKSAAERKHLELKDEIKPIYLDARQQKQTLFLKEQERKELDTQTGQQTSRLSELSKDTAIGWDWLKKNMDKLPLKDKVYGPPIIECSVPDVRYADAIESVVRQNDLTAITCTNAADTQIIQDKLVGSEKAGGLALHQISIRTIPQPRSYFKSPYTREELARLGFEGWMSDYIEGPDPVLAMLCSNAKLHSTAFSFNRISDEQRHALEKYDQLSKWISGRESYQINRRREYGVSSTSVSSLTTAKRFTGQPVATAQMKQLDETIAELDRELKATLKLFNEKKKELETYQKQIREAEDERQQCQAEQDQAKKAHATWEAIPRKIENLKSDLAEIKVSSQETKTRLKEIQTRHTDASLAIARDTLSYAKQVTQLHTLHESFIDAEIRLIEAESEVDGCKEDNREIHEAIQRQMETVAQLQAEHNAKVVEGRRAGEQWKRSNESATAEEQAIIREHQGLSMEELDNEIEGVSSRLNLMAVGNPRAVKTFEDRKREIERVEQALDEIAGKIEHSQDRIKEIREQWEPGLDEIIKEINDGFHQNFEKIGCAGQVEVVKDADFDKWAIEIRCKFREQEQLAVLNSHRQSGGERAVTTIFYLLALQGLARSPFRVVDEINQGMDPKNERMVHGRMVDIACEEHTSQYFLVTPKLLSDLKFHPKMKVHCIASGEFMPDPSTNLNFQSLAELALKVRKGIAAA